MRLKIEEKIHSNMARDYRSCYVKNENPTFTPPEKFFDSYKIEDIHEDLAKLKAELDNARSKLQQSNQAKKHRKKAHYFVKKVFAKAKGIDVFTSDIFMKSRGHKRRTQVNRRKLVNEAMIPLALMHDIVTGILPKSTITSLSDQLGVTTYGQKRYGEFEGVDLPEEDLRGKKKSISRLSRALQAVLCETGLVEKYQEKDDVTGKWIGTVMRVTDKFYKVMLMDADEVMRARWDKIRRGALENQYPADLNPDEDLTPYIQQKIAEIQQKRKEFAKDVRKRKFLASLSKAQVHRQAQCEVNAIHTESQLENMSDEYYSSLVNSREAELYFLRRNVEVPDTFFAELH